MHLSGEERKKKRYSDLSLQRALEAMHQDGLVVLKGVVDLDHIEALNRQMSADAEKKRDDPGQIYNHAVRSNFLQRPPVTSPDLLYEDIYYNPFVLQLANAYLGQKPIWNWLTANTALANTGGMRQGVHKDNAFIHPLYPYYFIANIPLCSTSIKNGATEFWLGSHAHTSNKDQIIATEPEQVTAHYQLGEPLPAITQDAQDARRSVRPPIQQTCSAGDIMIRDIRLWHAGMPNETDSHRIMLGLGYQSPVFPNQSMMCHLPAAQREFFENSPSNIEIRVQFYDEEEFGNTTRDSEFNLRPLYSIEKPV
ncbi:uncharacterized protein N7483_006239 [Penicillium malachiteum]|uniref:uncharacterized protein n=1 Tax=Penicillium malachiteum TaxID=1324776 RepID=UPI002546E332|nr:uncharacterized protein N7483_006239 [Penicillium malachiteum]KAJ5731731.1 hypothetical protein N7483_006239 [Penicillium malachiteum]